MKLSKTAAGAALIALVVGGCGGSEALFGGSGATSGGTGGSVSSTGTGGSGGAGTGGSDTGGAGTGGSGTGGEGASSSGTGGGTSCTPVGHDEDIDTVDDGCDSCPSYWNQGQENGDQDGVGDACEAPGDPALWHTIESFQAFVAPPGPEWNLGEFWHQPDELQVDTPYNAGLNADWQPPQAGLYSVETSFAFDGNSSGYAGLRFGINQAGAWWACLVERTWYYTSFRYNLGIWHYPGSGNQVLLQAEATDVGSEPGGIPRRVRAHVRPGGSLLCTYDDTENSHAELEHQAGSLDGQVGLRGYGTHAHFFSFVVYK